MIGKLYSDILFVRFLFKDNLVYLRKWGEAICFKLLTRVSLVCDLPFETHE